MAKLPPIMLAGREESERVRSKERVETVSYLSWYKTRAWQELRQQVLVRDLYTCRQTGVLLTGKHPAPNSPVVDHIKPHRGDYELFWSIDNLQAVSKSYHDSIKQAIERADQKASAHPPWLKPSLIPLTIVCGPIASGKSTFVNARARGKDLIIDLDVIASQISGEPVHSWDRERWLNAAIWRRNDMLGSLSRQSDYDADRSIERWCDRHRLEGCRIDTTNDRPMLTRVAALDVIVFEKIPLLAPTGRILKAALPPLGVGRADECEA